MESISSKKILIRYADNGGLDKSGIIEIRPGIAGLSLGDRKYAQVRIRVDKDWYIKGIAIYSNNIPDGYDIVYYTKYPEGTPMKINRRKGHKTETVFKRARKLMNIPKGMSIVENDIPQTLFDFPDYSGYSPAAKRLIQKINAFAGPELKKELLKYLSEEMKGE